MPFRLSSGAATPTSLNPTGDRLEPKSVSKPASNSPQTSSFGRSIRDSRSVPLGRLAWSLHRSADQRGATSGTVRRGDEHDAPRCIAFAARVSECLVKVTVLSIEIAHTRQRSARVGS